MAFRVVQGAPKAAPAPAQPRAGFRVLEGGPKRAPLNLAGPIGTLGAISPEVAQAVLRFATESIVPRSARETVLANTPLQRGIGRSATEATSGPSIPGTRVPAMPIGTSGALAGTPIGVISQALRVVPEATIGRAITKQAFDELSPLGIATNIVPVAKAFKPIKKVPVRYVGFQKSEVGPGMHLVHGPEASATQFNPKLHRIIGPDKPGVEVPKDLLEAGAALQSAPPGSWKERLAEGQAQRGQAAAEAVGIGSRTEKFQTQMTDRFAPVAHLVDAFEKVAGRKALPAENVYQGARLYAGIPGRIQARSRELGKILEPLGGETDDLSRVLIAERNAELSAQGRGLAEGAQIKLRSKQAVPVQSLEALQQELGPERFQQLQSMAKQVTDYNNKVLLADAVDAGVVSKEAAEQMLARNEKYVPFETLESLADDLLEEGGIRFGRQSFQVAKQDAFKPLEGGARILDDPLLAQARRIFKVTTLAERNRVGRKLLAMRKATPEAAGFIKPLAANARPPKDFSEFTVFENGTPTKVAIPTPVADSLKGLTQEAVDFITKFASIQSQLLRTGATTLSPGFALTNPIRDFQTAKFVSRSMGIPFNARTWARGFFEAIRKGQLYDDFEKSLGSFSGFYSRMQGSGAENVLKDIAPTTGQRIAKIANTALNPVSWIQKVGETLEMAPRLAVFGQAQKQGRAASESAFAARNATIDFARSGTAMKVANMWVPFLNARLQGTINTFRAVKGNPLGSAYLASSMIAVPQVATYWWNTRNFPDVWKDIPQFEKDGNFILVLGRDKDSSGRYTKVFKIPKGDVGRIIGNPTENVLAYLDGRDTKSVDELAMQMLSDVSPVGFEKDGKFSGNRLLGEALPPAFEAAEQLIDPKATNRFTGYPVVPRRLQEVSPELRATRNTSPLLRRAAQTPLGRAVGMSPIQAESAIGTMTGGGGRLALQAVDRLLFGKQPKDSAANPLERRFGSAKGGANEERLIERALAFKQTGTDRTERARQEAETLYTRLKETPDANERYRMLVQAQRRDPKIIDKLKTLGEDEQKGITTVDRIMRTMSTEQRAAFIAEQLREIRSVQAKQAFLQQLARKNLLTPKVRLALRKLQGQVAAPTAQAATRR